jgi:Co/Zn/Cd efflux system component
MTVAGFLTPQLRQYLYTVTSAVIAILVALRVIDPELVPLGLNLVAAALGLSSSTVAAVAVSAQRKDGTLG